MAAPKDNQYWKLRLKHGRDRIIQDPTSLWENACEYFQWCIENPLLKTEPFAFQGNVILQDIPVMRVFQKDGLALACGLSAWRTIEDLKKLSDDFLQIVTRIEKIIMTQKFEGASSGFFNSNIIARDLGLRDSQEISIDNTTTDALMTFQEMIIAKYAK